MLCEIDAPGGTEPPTFVTYGFSSAVGVLPRRKQEPVCSADSWPPGCWEMPGLSCFRSERCFRSSLTRGYLREGMQ